MIIDWTKYVDQIYCITFAGKQNYEQYKEDLYNELYRVNILNSGIYYEFENISTPFYKRIYESLFDDNHKYVVKGSNDNLRKYSYLYDCTMAHYYCMKHAKLHGYNKIIILEDDVVFLKNKEDIIHILDNALEKYCDGYLFLGSVSHVCYDHASEIPNARNTLYECTETVNYDIKPFNDDIGGGSAFNLYDMKAYSHFIDYIESGNFNGTDIYFEIYNNSNINIFYSDTYVCIQDIWFGFFLHATRNYPINMNKKEYYLEVMFSDSKKLFDNDLWISKLLFDEINSSMFNNELSDEYFYNKLKEYRG